VEYAYELKDKRAAELQQIITLMREKGDNLTDQEIEQIIDRARSYGIDVGQLTSEEFRRDLDDPNLTPEQVQRKHFETVFQGYPHGTGPTNLNSGFEVGLRYDARDNPRNTTRGFMLGVNYRLSPTWLGSTTTWHSLFAEGRVF